MARQRVTRIDRSRRNGHTGVQGVFALQSAIGNRASAALMREAGTATPTASKTHSSVFVTIEGEKQGKFKGSTPIRGREDAIQIHDYKMSITAPKDKQSGQATGARQHQGISFTKAIDDASPQFMQALTTNEALKSVTFAFVKPGPDGKEVQYQTVTLEGAQLASWTQEDDSEAVTLVYQKVTVSSSGGTTASDDWAKKQ
jgi:type VI secretion system Hcp family effector